MVSNAAELDAALGSATGGETILLAAGDYGRLEIYAPRQGYGAFDDTVTLKSADPANRASFSELAIRQADNIAFEDVTFDYGFSEGDGFATRPFAIADSSNITFDSATFVGDVAKGLGAAADGHGVAIGLSVRDSSGVTVVDSELSGFFRGLIFDHAEDVVVRNSEFHEMSSDGVDVVGTVGVVLEGNYFHDFAKPAASHAHMDMIQFWTAGARRPSGDIVIRDNVLHSGEGDWTQSIFMRNELVDWDRAGDEMYYFDVLIENNLIYNAQAHGVSVGQAKGLTIRDNTLLQNMEAWEGGSVSVPRIRAHKDAVDVLLENNITPLPIAQSNAAHVVRENVVAQGADPEGDNFYADVLVGGAPGAAAAVADLAINPESDIAGHGSTITAFDGRPESLTGVIDHAAGEGVDLLTVSFDADSVFGPNGAVDLAGASVAWDFGDDGTASGLAVAHSFKTAGAHTVHATVTLADGETLRLAKTIELVSPIAVRIDGAGGLQDVSANGLAVMATPDVTVEAAADDAGIRLNDGVLTVERSSAMLNNAAYTFGLDFKSDVAFAGAHKIVNFPYSFVVFLEEDGARVALTTDGGVTWLKAHGVDGLHDGGWHKLAVTFSGEAGEAVLYLDGRQVARADGLEGQIQLGSATNDFTIGDVHSNAQYGGLIDNVVMVKAALDAASVGDLSEFGAALGAKTILAAGSFTDWDSLQTEDQAPTHMASDFEIIEIESGDGARTEGDARSNMIVGAEGDDSIWAGGGNDELYGGDGADILAGQGDNDRLDGGAGDDYLSGHVGDDILVGGAGADRMHGGEGNDSYLVDDEGDRAYEWGEGVDTVYASASFGLSAAIENIVLLGQADLNAQGNAADNRLVGNSGRNVLHAGEGDDVVLGGAGDDILIGHGGADWLIGGAGLDRLNGGAGADVFVFGSGDGYDIVYGFEVGVDKIDLTGLGFAASADIAAFLHGSAGGTEIVFAPGEAIWLSGADIDDLSATDFIF